MSGHCCFTFILLISFVHAVVFTGAFLIDQSSTTIPAAESTTEAVTRDYRNTTVCYDGLGCFSNIPPFDNGAALLPASPDFINTTFYMCTQRKEACDDISYKEEINTTATHFNPSKITRIIIHGFTQNTSIYWVENMKIAFLERAAENVILVDWGNGASFPNYPQAVANVKLIGTQVYQFVQKLLNAGASLNNIHCIGHSLGAHVCGHAGTMLHGRMGRITGMDAAGPEFEGLDPRVRLDPTDALFVDAIHTNKAPVILGGLGIHQSVGHVDFIVNGGETQPGCPAVTTALVKLIQTAGTGGRREISCSHSRSHEVFIQSINMPCPFTAYRCNSSEDFENGKCSSCSKVGCSEMGLGAINYNVTGSMYLDTTATEPYCGYPYFVTLKTNETSTKGKVMIKLQGSEGESQWMMATREDNDNLESDAPDRRAVVSVVDVGRIFKVSIRYDMAHGFWFFGGKKTWEWQKVEIASGMSSQRVAVCSNGSAFQDGLAIDFSPNC